MLFRPRKHRRILSPIVFLVPLTYQRGIFFYNNCLVALSLEFKLSSLERYRAAIEQAGGTMDLDHFLKERIEFAMYFFETASVPFKSTIELINSGEEPFEPVYDESGEPQFMDEWLSATTGIDSVAITSISMLASSLQLFLNDWVARFESSETKFKRKNKKGWFHAYRIILDEIILDMSECPADLDLIEQAVLVRNRGQHPDQITSLFTYHSESDLKKFPSPYFVSESDRNRLEDDAENSWWLTPSIHIDEEKFKMICSQVEEFCFWLENLYRNT